ncbi:peptidase dimerization domain-containing protein [Streptomyces sp. RM72]|nr:peptidase dimerization domain-containing protein [Streptomyces sp. RM72]
MVMAAAVIMRLQTLSARFAPLAPSPLLTVGAVHAGTVPNVIPHTAELLCSLRTFDEQTRAEALAGLGRIVRAEAQARWVTSCPPPSRPARTSAASGRPQGALRSSTTSAAPTPPASTPRPSPPWNAERSRRARS